MQPLLDIDGIANRLIDPETGRRLTRSDIDWRSQLPPTPYESAAGDPVWSWPDHVIPFLTDTNRLLLVRNP